MARDSIIPKIIICTIFISILLALTILGCSIISPSSTQKNFKMPTETIYAEPEPVIIVEGTVLDIGVNELIISDLDHPKIVLRMTEKTSLWEGINWIAAIPVKKGDFVTAYGIWLRDYTMFTVQKYWVNQVNVMGVVKNVDNKNLIFVITDAFQGDRQILVYPHSKIYQNGNEGPKEYQDVHTLPQVGNYVEVIGRQIEDGSIIAVNIFVQ